MDLKSWVPKGACGFDSRLGYLLFCIVSHPVASCRKNGVFRFGLRGLASHRGRLLRRILRRLFHSKGEVIVGRLQVMLARGRAQGLRALG